jgi:hypothetical protein
MTLSQTVLKLALPQAHALKNQNREHSADLTTCIEQIPDDTIFSATYAALNTAFLVASATAAAQSTITQDYEVATLYLATGTVLNSVLGNMAYYLARNTQEKAYHLAKLCQRN